MNRRSTDLTDDLPDDGVGVADGNTDRLYGTVVRVNPDKGFGFIREPHTGQDYFFHYTELNIALTAVVMGQTRVRFKPVKVEKGNGWRANEVEVIE